MIYETSTLPCVERLAMAVAGRNLHHQRCCVRGSGRMEIKGAAPAQGILQNEQWDSITITACCQFGVVPEQSKGVVNV